MIEVVRADITTLDVDAIVNAANRELAGGGGVDGAIHRAAGPQLLAASRALGPIPDGCAVLTPGFRLRARYVIHAVGPVWSGSNVLAESELLDRAYLSSFRVALSAGTIRSIAFPAISTGVYHFPRDLAAGIAIGEMRFHEGSFERVIACAFEATTAELYRTMLALIERDGADQSAARASSGDMR